MWLRENTQRKIVLLLRNSHKVLVMLALVENRFLPFAPSNQNGYGRHSFFLFLRFVLNKCIDVVVSFHVCLRETSVRRDIPTDLWFVIWLCKAPPARKLQANLSKQGRATIARIQKGLLPPGLLRWPSEKVSHAPNLVEL